MPANFSFKGKGKEGNLKELGNQEKVGNIKRKGNIRKNKNGKTNFVRYLGFKNFLN